MMINKMDLFNAFLKKELTNAATSGNSIELSIWCFLGILLFFISPLGYQLFTVFWSIRRWFLEILSCNVCNRNHENIKLFLAIFVRIWLDKFPGSKLLHFFTFIVRLNISTSTYWLNFISVENSPNFLQIGHFYQVWVCREWDVTLFDTIYKLPRKDFTSDWELGIIKWE